MVFLYKFFTIFQIKKDMNNTIFYIYTSRFLQRKRLKLCFFFIYIFSYLVSVINLIFIKKN